MAETILVIGGTGMLGEPVARSLHTAGYCVRILTRSPEKAARFKDGFEIAAGDVENLRSLEQAMRGCQGVHVSLHDASNPDLERVGAINAARAAATVGVSRITYLSGASVIPENCWFPDTKTRYEAEAAIRASGVSYTIFKGTWFMESLNRFVRGKFALAIGRHPRPWRWLAAQDYARMVATAYATPATANKTLWVYGPETYTTPEALRIYCAIVHPDARLMPMPFWLATLFARLRRRRELQAALPFFRYCERVTIAEAGDPAEANALLGAPTTTLAVWSRQKMGSA
jgi:uncharacterized protein YbjT (DUF2867 family)